MPRGERRAAPAPSSGAGRPTEEDRWLALAGAELGEVARGVGLLGAATPVEAQVERARLLVDFARGADRLPRWTYPPAASTLAARLRRVDGLRERLASLEPAGLHALYRARADELRLELQAAAAVGTPDFAARALARFAPRAEHAEARELAARWCRIPTATDLEPGSNGARVMSDDPNPGSLVSRLRHEVARGRLPFEVRTSASMSALAAISGDTIWVAEGRMLTPLDVERTVTHEVEAHALPRVRARSAALSLFAVGTAGGNDDQEGYALWLEEHRGLSSAGRKKELGARHEAVALMRSGADFVGVVRTLRGLLVPLEASLRIAERAFRGSNGVLPGLGRESVYLEALVRVRALLGRAPEDEHVLCAGQVSVDAVDVLRPWVKPAANA